MRACVCLDLIYNYFYAGGKKVRGMDEEEEEGWRDELGSQSQAHHYLNFRQ